MKRIRFLCLTAEILASALVFAQQPSSPAISPSGTLKFENGLIANGIYSNECLGFSFLIPVGWELETQFVDTDGKARHRPDGILLLYIHRQPFPGKDVELTAHDASGQGGTARDYVSNVVHTQISLYPEARELIRDAFAVDYGGKRFFRADYKQSLHNGGTLYQSFIYTKFRGYFIGETLMAGSPEELNEWANSLQWISFQEDQPNSKCVMGEDSPLPVGVIGGVIGSAAQPSTTGQPLRVRVSQGVGAGLLIKKIPPHYPIDARQAHIQGQVVLTAVISKSGDVEELTLASGHPMLAPSAIAAVKKWKFKPYLVEGQPVEVETQIVVNFSLVY
jgi:TonB family protein